jgi:hypothetical protein
MALIADLAKIITMLATARAMRKFATIIHANVFIVSHVYSAAVRIFFEIDSFEFGVFSANILA